MILSGDCTACGRCVDVCPERVFRFTHRFDRRLDRRLRRHAVPERSAGIGRRVESE